MSSLRPHELSVYRAAQFRVVNGANMGDPVGLADELVLDDIYHLSPIAMQETLLIELAATPPYRIHRDSGLGQAGADLYLDCCVSFMCGTGETIEALVLVETGADDAVDAVYLMPLAPLLPRTDYVLMGVSPEAALQRFATSACVSFAAGTRITLSTGAQMPVEELTAGDKVLTRDDGPQPIRWIGHRTIRAAGAFAPILIKAGVLNNADDLTVSPDQGLFIYQRADKLGAGRSEVLVRARHLVNGTSVVRKTGGFVDYYQMLFDSHHIIFAEGIAAESMLVNSRTRAVLPEELSDKLNTLIPGHRRSDHGVYEVRETLLSRPDAADILRKSSTG